MAQQSGDERTAHAFLVKVNNTTQIGNTNKGTHSLHCGIVHEPDIAARTRAVWVHRRVAVVLLERTCGVIRLVADSARIGSRRRRAGRLNDLNDLDRDRDCCKSCKTYAMDLLLVLQHHPSTRGILENAEKDTNIDKDSFALADTFTGCTNIEGGPRSGLDMIEERLGRHILVGTRAGRVGTGGHSAGAGAGKSLSRHNNVYKYKLPQGDLAPKGMFAFGVAEPTFRACRWWAVRSNPCVPDALLTSLAYRACLASRPRGCCVLCTPAADRRWGCYVVGHHTTTTLHTTAEASRVGDAHPW